MEIVLSEGGAFEKEAGWSWIAVVVNATFLLDMSSAGLQQTSVPPSA